MLIRLLNEAGFKNVVGYDPFFEKNEEVWNQKYSFITICEVIEHVYKLKSEFERLLSCLKPAGIIVISTGIYTDQKLEHWHYLKDPTHVNCFSPPCIEWMAKNYELEYSIPEKDIIVFLKK